MFNIVLIHEVRQIQNIIIQKDSTLLRIQHEYIYTRYHDKV